MTDPQVAGCKSKLAGFVTLIFVCGLAVGALGMHLYDKHQSPAWDLAQEKQMAIEHFNQELNLNDEQSRAIEAILDEFIMQQADLVAQFRTSRLSGHDRILQILNDDQRQRFQQVLSDLQTRRHD